MHSLEKSQALQLTDCKCSRQVANLKSGGEEGLHLGQPIFWRRGGVVLEQMTTLGVQRETGGLKEGRGGNKLGSHLREH